jgi:hypothetical protein
LKNHLHAETLANIDLAITQIANIGFALVRKDAVARHADIAADALHPLSELWNDLPSDTYLRDGGHYRRRRHGCFVHDLERDALVKTEHRAHFQSTDYNALHGGIERWFEPLQPAMVESAEWQRWIKALGRLFSDVSPCRRWHIEVHPFRIDTRDGVGRPTPEGAHRDGVDFVAIALIERWNIRGGETRVFESDGPRGVRFTMEEPWSVLLLDDARVIHETTPIQPSGEDAHRDTLVITFRRDGFQAP